jgi:hypothetical protein
MRRQLAGEIALRVLAVYSPEDAAWCHPLALELELGSMPWANNPVSVKHQAGLNAIRRSHPDVDAVIYAGSDDFLSPDYVRLAAATACGAARYCPPAPKKRGAQAVLRDGTWCGPDRVYMLDAPTGRLALWQGPMRLPYMPPIPSGAGRCFSRRVLELAAWQLWPFDRDQGLDTHSSRRMMQVGCDPVILDLSRRPAAVVIDVKGLGNIHAFAKYEAKNLLAPDLPAVQADRVCELAGIDRAWWVAGPAAPLG